MCGELAASGVGVACESAEVRSMGALADGRQARNKILCEQLREDTETSVKIHESTMADAALGRMSVPRAATASLTSELLLHPRFGVSQSRPDGSTKLRVVDHMSWSASKRRRLDSVNGYTFTCEKMQHESLDSLAAAMKYMFATCNVLFGLFKADVDSAFRRVPISADYRWCCAVAYKVKGEVQFFLLCVVIPCHSAVAGNVLSSQCLPIWSSRERSCLGKAGGSFVLPR